VCDALHAQVQELSYRCDDLKEEWGRLHEWCQDEMDRLHAADPPQLVRCRLAHLDRAGRDLVERLRDHENRSYRRGKRVGKIGREVDGLDDQLVAAEAQGELSESFGLEAELAERFARASLLTAKQCDSEAAVRRLETKLWRRGVRIRSPSEDAAAYQHARAADPDFDTVIGAYTRAAARHRQKSELEMALAGLQRQARVLMARLERTDDEYLRVRDVEGLGKES
jgi:hypothetical protein